MSIPTPPDLARGKVSWTVGRTDGTTLPGARGSVRFDATAVAVAYSTATVLPAPVETPVVAGVMTPVDLLVNDPEVWNWRVTPSVGVDWDPFHIDVDGPLDLSSAVIVPGKGLVRVLRGAPGPGVVGAVDGDDNTFQFVLADGTLTVPITLPDGIVGPGNVLKIGTVTHGTTASATITGTAPAQTLNLVLPRGEKGDQGDRGPASTVPGPANTLTVGTVQGGSSAAATLTGTAPAQTLNLTLPRGAKGDQGDRGPAGNVNVERPAEGVWDLQPEALDIRVTDVTGLAARLAALERNTGVRNIRSLFINGWKWYGYAPILQRIGPWCEIRAYVDHSEATDDRLLELPIGFQPGSYSRPVGTVYASSTTEARSFLVSTHRINIPRGRLTQSQNMISAVWITRDPWPATLPGDPA